MGGSLEVEAWEITALAIAAAAPGGYGFPGLSRCSSNNASSDRIRGDSPPELELSESFACILKTTQRRVNSASGSEEDVGQRRH